MAKRSFWRYENGLLAMLSVGLGFTILDRVSLTLLSPFILTDLHLNNTDLGVMAAALSVTLAISGYVFGRASDHWGNRKLVLVIAVLFFSLFSSISGLAISLFTMVAARLVMGLTEGPILPLSYSIMAMESSAHRRSFNHGLLANLATCLIGGVLGPILLVHIAQAYSWRVAFFLVGVPGLITALLMLRFVREPKVGPPAEIAAEGGAHPTPALLASRRSNIALCLFLLCGLYTWLLVTLAFMPLYLVRVVGMKPTDMAMLSAFFGLSGCTCAIGVSWLADRIGRKPTAIIFSIVGLLVPLGALMFPKSIPVLALSLFFGWSYIGCSPLFAGTIPAESSDPAKVARTLALIIGVAEIVGGVLMPVLAGSAADRWGLAAPLWIVFGATALTAVGACFLKETAPGRIKRGVVAEPRLLIDKRV
jgi:ACS family hexuronate transporter-like MFS transporter